MQIKASYLRWSGLILMCLLLAVIVTKVLSPTKKPAPVELFKQFFVPFENDIVNTEKGFAAQHLKEQAFRLYDQKRYNQALILFDELLKTQTDQELVFFQGNTLLALGQYQNAYSSFKQIPEGHNRHPHAQWYAALAYMMMEKGEELNQLLKKIIANNPTYKEKARQLLKLLN